MALCLQRSSGRSWRVCRHPDWLSVPTPNGSGARAGHAVSEPTAGGPGGAPIQVADEAAHKLPESLFRVARVDLEVTIAF